MPISVEHVGRDASHQRVLRLVGRRPGLAAPGDHEQHGNAEDEAQRGERIDGVPEAGVLQQHEGARPTELGAARDRDGIALVGGTDVANAGTRLREGRDQRSELRAGHAGRER